MRSKAPLALMEQLVMVLVFALAAALCVQAFAVSGHMSHSGAQRDQAVILAQNVAEVYKHCAGKQSEAIQQLGGEASGNLWTSFYNENLASADSAESAAYEVNVEQEHSSIAGLGTASVKVSAADDGEILFSLSVSWQEGFRNA